MFAVVLVLVAGLGLVLSSPSPRSFSIHEERTNIARGWFRVGRRAPPAALLPLKIGLKESNIEKLHDRLLDVSHPDSENYGKHWTPEKVKTYFRPSEESVSAVIEWLEEAGVERARIELSKGDNWVQVKDFSVAEAERILDTEYHVYQHTHGDTRLACSAYSVPAHVQHHIELITPTLHFDGRPSSKRGTQLSARNFKAVSAADHLKPDSNDLSNCDVRITPPCYRALYNIPAEPTIRAASQNSFAIVEYTPQAYLGPDLDLFFANFSPSLVGSRPELISIDGGVVQTEEMDFGVNIESNFDIGYAMTLVGPGQPVRLYQVEDIPEGSAQLLAPFNDLLDALDGSYCTEDGGDDPSVDGVYPDPAPGGYQGPKDCGNKQRSNVISVSYASNEADLTPFYQIRQCSEYGKLGLMGITFIFASGDSGVAGNGELCLFPNGTQSEDAPLFNPLFPANCPFVTGVGATQVNPGSTVFDPESAASLTGGGFSNIFALPEYQKKAIEEYYKYHEPPYGADRYNNSQRARGIPDFSVNGVNCTVVAEGRTIAVAGTSAAPPVIGAIITLINDARLAAGKSPVGFINPAIYSNAFRGAFKDIVDGINPGCGTDGFESVEGWDPVSGLGTPDFEKLLDLWMNLP
ncbi:peptidase S8/S53 domain-containing protein [Mycena albidolilacea]|uniref:Peptidase S8/S53 domain-containing protein n=1 Tax=Mycena albidolilacea TaxID=1033008 RepID=A0AAD7AAU6_9AGAR|nr:peptidase S8/S53 domain-containing protein [Mycena albidolilacea]